MMEVSFWFKLTSGWLEGDNPRLNASELFDHPEEALLTSKINSTSDLMITAQIFADSKPLTHAVSTLYKSFKSSRKWNEWLTLPILYSQLPLRSQLALTIWDFDGPGHKIPYGGTTLHLFETSDCTLKSGRQKLKVWSGVEADGKSHSATESSVHSSDEMDRLEKLIKRHEAGDLVQVDWLDNLVFRKIEQINKTWLQPKQEHLLFIELAQFDFPVVYSDIEYSYAQSYISSNQQLSMPMSLLDEAGNSGTLESSCRTLVLIHDADQARENPIESKYRRLVRSHKSSPLDRDLKPNAKIRDDLNTIMQFSPVQELSDDEKNLLWKFRYYLTRHKQALTKFLKAITWEDPVEAKQAVELLPKWAEINIDDALELLGPNFKDANVRSYAVDRLRKASDHELALYLLQLVEALKFEPRTKKLNAATKSYLARFLIGRAVRNSVLGTYLYWYLSVEAQEKGNSSSTIYQPVLSHFLTLLANQENGEEKMDGLKAQIKLMNNLLTLATNIKTSKESRPRKVEILRSFLADSRNGLSSFSPISFPLNPTINVVGILAEDANVFKSSLSPLKLTFRTDTGGTYPIIFKSGDDLRQDQLVVQIINLMDQLLQNENLDLRLTPYQILATGTKDGAMQFIPNQTLSQILSEYHGVIPYLAAHNRDDQEPLGIKFEAMDTYIRSCAGYCVITYILGVGDRHLDNLLVSPDGHFFHADYGYILGRDPKPFPPLMKLPIQLIDGMGGISSDNYDKFRNYCFTAYTTLRKSANLILNLFALMTDSSIPDIMFERTKAVQKVKEKFCLDMTEEQAILHFQNLINDSVNAFLPMVIDRLHNMAQYWRA